MIKYQCVGYDLRVWPHDGYFSSEINIWPRDEDAFTSAMAMLCTEENIFQLIDIESQKEMKCLIDLASNFSNIALVGFEMPKLLISTYCSIIGVSEMNSYMNKEKWKSIGYDIVDMNGLYSGLHMEIFREKSLFTLEEEANAYLAAQIAALKVPTHAPFAVTKMNILNEFQL